MSGILDVLDADKWRKVIADFDDKRVKFVNELSAISGSSAVTRELDATRRKLVADAAPIKLSIDTLYNSLRTVRDWLRQIGSIFQLNGAGGAIEGLGVAPIVIGVGLAAAAAIVASITDWLKKVAQYKAANDQARILKDAGATPEEIIKATKGLPGTSAKLFGFDVRWILAIGGLFLIGPWVLRKLK